MILNDELRFDALDEGARRAFLRLPDKILLRPGTQLYKWTDRALAGPTITPWWSFVESTRLPSGIVADGFRVSEERAARLGRPHREFARSRAAISGQFKNNLTNLIVIQLKVPAWGFAGQCSGQPEFDDEHKDLSHVFLIGGAFQVYMPNVALDHVMQLPAIG